MLKRIFSFLTKKCLFGTPHWRWDRLCQCGLGQISTDPGSSWHGGYLDTKTNIELHPCVKCTPEYSVASSTWALTDEEVYVVLAWRAYRHSFLDAFPESGSYRYVISVDLNGTRQDILERTIGLAALSLNKNMPQEEKPS